MKINGVNEVEREEEKRNCWAQCVPPSEEPQSSKSGVSASLLFSISHGALTHKDVKNEGASGDMYENKGKSTKYTPINPDLYKKVYQYVDRQTEIGRLFGPK
jgi:hypothetical protein